MDGVKEITTFEEALVHLGIEDYRDRIFNSNSHGELFHLCDYIVIANMFKDFGWFRGWFVKIVEIAEDNWQRPQSVFQHILRILQDGIDYRYGKSNGNTEDRQAY